MKNSTAFIFVLTACWLSACASTTMDGRSAVSLAPPHAPLIEGQTVPVTAHKDPRFLLQSDDPQLAANKRLVYDMWRTILDAGQVEAADRYLAEDYIQHNPTAPTGRAGFKEYFAMRPDSSIDTTLEDPLVAMVAEGDLVVQVLQEERAHPDTGETYYVAWFDMFRIKDGRVIEHWDTASKGELPAVMQQQNN